MTLILSSNLIRISIDETNFPHKLLLTNKKIWKGYRNDSSTNIKFSKAQLFKIQLRGFNILDLMNPAEVVYKIVNKAMNLSNEVSLDNVIRIAAVSRKLLPDPKKDLPGSTILGTGITLTNNEIKNILENRGIFLKETTRKITN